MLFANKNMDGKASEKSARLALYNLVRLRGVRPRRRLACRVGHFQAFDAPRTQGDEHHIVLLSTKFCVISQRSFCICFWLR